MFTSTGALIFWFIAIGFTIGFLSFYIFKERGVGLLHSMGVGTAGSLTMGSLSLVIGLPNALTLSLVGALSFLFITNSFRQKEKPVFIETSDS